MRLFTSSLLAAVLLVSGRAGGATKSDVLDSAVKAANRLQTIRSVGRNWEDVPYLVGLLLVAEQLEKRTPGSGQLWIDRVANVIGGGDAPIANGDYAGYAQAAMDLYRLASPADTATRAALLQATDGPIEFAAHALRTTPSNSPPLVPWWVDGGYGTRFWVDDLFTLPPWLAMRGAKRDGLPADPTARDLAYEWIESYLYDHRPSTTDAMAAAVPSERQRAGPLLWNPGLSLFRHDPGSGATNYWGRGNGWAAWGLACSARYLDAPYGGGRYDEVVDRTGIRELLSRFASALVAHRSDDGGWPTDLAHPETCPASETSATGLITYMLAKGVNEGWLDRTAFTPIVLKGFSLLLGRLDARGDLAGIQPPGTGPDCGVTTSNDPAVDVSYGVGAFLLAASETLKLPDVDLATLENVASRPVDRTPIGRTWLLAMPDGCDRHEVLLTNEGTRPVHARLESGSGALAETESADVAPGGSVVLGIARADAEGEPFVFTLRSDGDIAVRPRAVCGEATGVDDGTEPFVRPRSRRAGIAVPLWTALAGGEGTTFVQKGGGLLRLGGKNTSPNPASMLLEIHAADGVLVERSTRELPPGDAVLETRFVPAGSRVILSNASEGAALVPLEFPQGR
ncbi:MAG: glycoside hydrolase family 88 protein [Thermoanaerobaculia bacterium]|nr:glycoside hydrolase family 88 protein [Thermoanaerobaculia bacterium]